MLYAIVGLLWRCTPTTSRSSRSWPRAPGRWRDASRLLAPAAAGATRGSSWDTCPGLLIFLDQKGNSISILAFYAPLTLRGVGRELLRLFPGHPSFVPSELPGTDGVWLAGLAVGGRRGERRARGRARGAGLPPAARAALVLSALLAVATPIGFTIYSAPGRRCSSGAT